MRILAIATGLLLASTLVPVFAQQSGPNAAPEQSQTAPGATQPQTVPVQPQRTPQESEQSRKQERERGEDVRIRQGWRAEERDGGDMGRSDSGRMMDRMGRLDQNDRDRMARMCARMMERMGCGMRGDEGDMDRDHDHGYRRYSYSDDHRTSRRVKICIEDENGDEYCRYRSER